ncbi:MAG: NAD(P)H-binding protein [Chloroflexi bacterium]|nr:NAD(P)H-binding protein [Chloroflexota bacterium]
MARRNWNKVFVTGATSFIGLRVVTELVNAGADVTVLVRPDHEEKLGTLRRHVRLVYGDVWNIASLKGRSRGHGVVIHLVGSLHAQPEHGQTFQQINLVSARNAISMAISDGVPYFVLLSTVSNPPGVSIEYLRSKRTAEEYLRSSGLRWAVVRAPILFDRQQSGGLFFALLSRIGSLPLLRVFFGRRAPLPVDIVARGIAQIALQTELPRDRLFFAGNLRRLGRLKKNRRLRLALPRLPRRSSGRPRAHPPEDETPFGWLPPPPPSDDD